ncbi:Ig-like domain-containing protein [Undibacterium piscinae]|uniref:Ig-like domain-containing protein n=1 Tax=Undibacterium piscinae TaxID=2495591 RepID=A0A6M4A7G2_9BURK|nr:Ig-like domain-containing protein [Undibacterium piscinae]
MTGTAGNYSYSVAVPGADLLGNGNVHASVSSTDTAGNPAVATADHTYTVDTTASASITIATVAGDDIVNAAESNKPVTLSGTVGGDAKAGDIVTLTVGTHTYNATVTGTAGNYSYSVAVPGADLLGNGNVHASVSSTDAAGNPAVATADHTYTVDTTANASITIATVAGDDIVNAAESNKPVTLSGTVSGDAKAGDIVTLTVGTHTYNATVTGTAGNYSYSVAVPGADLLGSSNVHASVSTMSASGNPSTAATDHTYTVDTTASASITIATVAGDDIVNAAESNKPVTLSGTVGGDAKAGDIVTLTVGTHTYNATVTGTAGNYSYSVAVPGADLLGNGNVHASVSSTDTAGNPAVATADHTYTVDTTANASITIATVAGDDIVNAAESNKPVTLSGTVSGDAKAGDIVTLTVGTHTYNATVTGTAGNYSYSVAVPGADLLGNGNVHASVSTMSASGNPSTAATDHTYTVDTTASASITIATVAGDDIVNAAESNKPVTLSGTVSGDAKAGDIVTLTVGTHTYNATVTGTAGNYSYSVAVPGADLLGNGNVHASVSSTDAAGNPAVATADHTYTVDTTASASITIATVAGDDIVNAAESNKPVTLSGTVSGDAKAGDIVTLTVGTHTYNATVTGTAGNYSYSVAVPGADLLGNGNVHASVSSTDTAGNPAVATADHTYTVDTTANASITIATVAGDDIVNAAESNKPVTLSGTVGGDAKAGDIVTLTVGTHTYSATVTGTAGNYSYSVAVPGADLLGNGNVHASVSTMSASGNPSTAATDHTYTVDTTASASITIATVAGDDIVNAAESNKPVTLSGTVSGDAKAGDIVTLTVGTHTYNATVTGTAGNYSYSVAVPGADLLGNGNVHASVSSTDTAGNPAVATADHTYTVDTTASASITIATVAGDDIVNAAESNKPVTLSGTVGGDAKAGDIVTLTVGTHTYNATVTGTAGNYSYSVAVPGADLLGNGNVHASVSSTDTAGNPAVATADHTYTVDTTASASITIATVAGDDIVNAAESGSGKLVTLSGTVGGDAKAGDIVTLTVGTHTYNATVTGTAGNYSYSVAVPGADLLGNGNVHASVSSTDTAGNPAVATADHTYTVDTTASASITIATVAGDDIVNAAESNKPVTLSGTVGGDAKAGDIVTLTVGTHTYNATVTGTAGNYSYSVAVPGADLLGNGNVHASVSSTDAAGNPAVATADHTYTVDTTANASITIATVAGDDIVNAAESNKPVTLSGTVGGDAKAGDIVTLTVGTHTYNATVTGTAGNYSYSVAVPGADLLGNGNVHASVSSTDAAGNPAVATADHTYTVDTTASASITIATVAGDDIVNAAESNKPVTLSGTVGGDAKAGDIVTLTVGTHTYNATVTGTAGNYSYSVAVPGADLLGNGNVHASVSSTDTAGNPAVATADHTYTVDTTANASITIATVAGDDIVNAAESNKPVTLSGTVSGDAKAGDIVTLTVGTHTYNATVTGTAGNYSYSVAVPGADLLGNGNVHASVSTMSASGNPSTAATDHTYTVDTTASASITIATVAGDDIVNAAESNKPVTLSGTVSGDAKAGDIVTLTVGTHTYNATVTGTAGNYSYSVAVPGADLLGNGNVHASVSTMSASGNPSTAATDHTYTVDTTASASITIATVAGDDIVNAAESNKPVTLSGTVSGDAKAGDIVTLTVGTHTYNATVTGTAGNYSYSVAVPGADLLGNGNVHASVSSTDTAGNPAVATADHTYTVDTTASASITIATVAGDDIVNAAESNKPVTLSGTVSGDAKAGDIVTLTVGTHTYNATVTGTAGNYSYSVAVPGADLLGNGNVHASVSSTDAAGNPAVATADHTYTVDTTANASITIATVAGDDIVNAAESGSGKLVTLSGTVGGDAKAGDIVTLTVGTHTYNATVTGTAGNYSYSVAVPGADLLGNGNVHASVSSTDTAGNPAVATADHTYTVDTTASASITIATVAGDDIVNAAESGSGKLVTLSGTVGGDAKAGDIVTLTVGAHTYNATVTGTAGNYSYSVAVPGADLLGNGNVHASVSSTDTAGNPAVATADHTYTVDTTASASITIATVAGDDIVNAAESGSGKLVTLSGTVGGDAKAGDIVTLTVGTHTYNATVTGTAGNYSYSVAVPGADLLGNGNVHASVSSTDTAGNPAVATADHTYTVDTTASASITIATVAGDDIVNAAESGSGKLVTLSGTVGGDAKAGDIVTLTVGTHTYNATVTGTAGNYSYSVAVPGADLLGNGNVHASVSSTDTAGNPAVATADHTYTVDTTASASITIATVAGDDIVNAAESNKPVTLSGTVGGDAKAGDIVTLTVGTHTYNATVTGTAGNYSYSVAVPGADLLGNGNVHASVSTMSASGNPSTAATDHTYTVDTTASASITIATVAGDDIVNAAESGSGKLVTLSGTVGGDAKAGDIVTLTVGTHTYNATVTGTAGNYSYSVAVPGADLLGNGNVHASVSSTDTAGNPAVATADHTYTVDTTGPAVAAQTFSYAENSAANSVILM